jgi:hypothetical protein
MKMEMTERMAAIRAATPATMIVALVSLLPVPEGDPSATEAWKWCWEDMALLMVGSTTCHAWKD